MARLELVVVFFAEKIVKNEISLTQDSNLHVSDWACRQCKHCTLHLPRRDLKHLYRGTCSQARHHLKMMRTHLNRTAKVGIHTTELQRHRLLLPRMEEDDKKILRHRPEPRDLTALSRGNSCSINFQRFLGDTNSWSTQQRVDCLMKGTSKIRFEHCLNSLRKIQYLRALQGNTGEVSVDPHCRTTWECPTDGRIILITFGASWDRRSIADAG